MMGVFLKKCRIQVPFSCRFRKPSQRNLVNISVTAAGLTPNSDAAIP
jgi:hypothetical protein